MKFALRAKNMNKHIKLLVVHVCESRLLTRRFVAFLSLIDWLIDSDMIYFPLKSHSMYFFVSRSANLQRKFNLILQVKYCS